MHKLIKKPWGHEIIWALTRSYVGKTLFIRAGEQLSLQYHRKKEETLLVIDGTMKLVIEKNGRRKINTLKAGKSFHIKPGVRHRMIAITDCNICEVSTPELDDVVRLEDKYGRV